MNMPTAYKKKDKAVRASFASLKPLTYSMKTNGCFLGGSLDFTVKQATANRTKKMNPIVLIIQGKPTLWIILSIMIGRTTPPSEEPDTMIPKAKARRRMNQDTTEAIEAEKMAEEPADETMAWARKNW